MYYYLKVKNDSTQRLRICSAYNCGSTTTRNNSVVVDPQLHVGVISIRLGGAEWQIESHGYHLRAGTWFRSQARCVHGPAAAFNAARPNPHRRTVSAVRSGSAVQE